MAGVVRNFTRRLIFVPTLLCCVVFAAACLTPFVSSETFWLTGFLGLSFPYLATLLLFSVIFWLIAKPKYAITPFFVLLFGYKQFSVLFATHPRNNFKNSKQVGNLRIVDWNVGNMYGLSRNNDTRKHNRTEIANAVLKLNPDIICLQEFNHSLKQGEEANNIGLFSQQYPFY